MKKLFALCVLLSVGFVQAGRGKKVPTIHAILSQFGWVVTARNIQKGVPELLAKQYGYTDPVRTSLVADLVQHYVQSTNEGRDLDLPEGDYLVKMALTDEDPLQKFAELKQQELACQ